VSTEMIEGFLLSQQQLHIWTAEKKNGFPLHAESLIRIEGQLDRSRLEAAVQRVIDDHEILRTTLQCPPGLLTPVQVVAEPGKSCLFHYEDVSATATLHQDGAAREIFAKARSIPFDVQCGPLLRASLICLSAGEHLLHLSLHPVCSDAIGLANLFQAFCAAYQSVGVEKEQSAEPLQYADFAGWQSELLEQESSEQGQRYWKSIDSEVQRLFPARNGIGLSPQETVLGRIERVLKPHSSMQLLSEKQPAVSLLACWQILLSRLFQFRPQI
jgi:hypothetical protein